MMNIVMLMSGGVGKRFGSLIPKQYNLISGRPVIDYVIDAIQSSLLTDKVVVVIDSQWAVYSEKLKKSGYLLAPNGNTRLESVQNGLCTIKENYRCDKLLIVDAVAPFLYGKLIDDYFTWLDEYDAVITAQKITGGFTNQDSAPLDREEYIITQSPEAFRFDYFFEHFDVNYPYQEMACMLPKEAKRFYYYGFKNNLKLTYDYELRYAEYVLEDQKPTNSIFFEKELLITQGLKSYLLIRNREETLQWIDFIYAKMPDLIKKWSISSFVPNQESRFGLVLLAHSLEYGDVVIKFIPDFVHRFHREVEALQHLPKEQMCPLLDYDGDSQVMLLKQIKTVQYASFDEFKKLEMFFKSFRDSSTPYDANNPPKYIPMYFDELRDKLKHVETVPYMESEISTVLEDAICLYEKRFAHSPLYIIHGDLHELNLLDDSNRLWGIDPNGFIAPQAFEFVRFMRNDVRNHPKFGYENRLKMLLFSFACFCDVDELLDAFIIDMAFCTYNSAFENETPEETRINLELIGIAQDYYRAKSLK